MNKDLQKKASTSRCVILLIIFLSTILIRYITAEYTDIGGDNSFTYYFVKHLVETGSFLQDWNQHSIRWSITVPLYFLLKTFGVHPLLYYVLPFLFAGIGSVLIYLIGEKIWGRTVGLWAFLLILLFPQMAQTGSQLWPSIFQFPAAALSIYLIYRWSETKSPVWLVLSACAFFYSWGARASGIYFFPGLLWILWMECKRVRPVIFYCIISAALLILESFVLWKLTGNPLGKIGVVKSNHVGTMEAISFFQYLGHIANVTKLKGLLPIYITALICAVTACRKSSTRSRSLAVFYLTGSFLLVYMVSSVHPIRIAQPHGTRYWCQFAPFGLLLIASQLYRLKQHHNKTAVSLYLLILASFTIFTVKIIPPVNALTQMSENQTEVASILKMDARYRFIWHDWSPNWVEKKVISMFGEPKPRKKHMVDPNKMRKEAQRMMWMYAPVSVVKLQTFDNFSYQDDGSCIYTPSGVPTDALIAAEVNFDRKNCFITATKDN